MKIFKIKKYFSLILKEEKKNLCTSKAFSIDVKG